MSSNILEKGYFNKTLSENSLEPNSPILSCDFNTSNDVMISPCPKEIKLDFDGYNEINLKQITNEKLLHLNCNAFQDNDDQDATFDSGRESGSPYLSDGDHFSESANTSALDLEISLCEEILELNESKYEEKTDDQSELAVKCDDLENFNSPFLSDAEDTPGYLHDSTLDYEISICEEMLELSEVDDQLKGDENLQIKNVLSSFDMEPHCTLNVDKDVLEKLNDYVASKSKAEESVSNDSIFSDVNEDDSYLVLSETDSDENDTDTLHENKICHDWENSFYKSRELINCDDNKVISCNSSYYEELAVLDTEGEYIGSVSEKDSSQESISKIDFESSKVAVFNTAIKENVSKKEMDKNIDFSLGNIKQEDKKGMGIKNALLESSSQENVSTRTKDKIRDASPENVPQKNVSKSKGQKASHVVMSNENIQTVKPTKDNSSKSKSRELLNGSCKNSCSTSKEETIKSIPKSYIKDYLEFEKEDITDLGWEEVKNLNTDFEHYNNVRHCWGSKSVPNPYKNLTYHSYRKRHCSENKPIKQHKRKASRTLNNACPKRQRTCTFLIDEQLNDLYTQKQNNIKSLEKKYNSRLSTLDSEYFHHEKIIASFNPFSGFQDDRYRFDKLQNLKAACKQDIRAAHDEYIYNANECEERFKSKTYKLRQAKNEIVQFCNFYGGLFSPNDSDPTILTDNKLQEVEDIENIYQKFDYYYK